MRFVLLAAFCFLTTAATADEPEAMFPFGISNDATIKCLGSSLAPTKPAGGDGFVRTDGSRFVNDAGEIRFWGTNLCFDANFPSHQQAEALAARLAQFGFNCIRLHHMDSRSIWGRSGNHRDIDPERLEKLDYLIDQLRRRGIYVNINLHVSRWPDQSDGFPSREGRTKYDKGVDNYYPALIELQKDFARDLLTHRNPYTGNRYVDEPAVAMIEINNENALFAEWCWNHLDALVDPFAAELKQQWNDWLKERYGTIDALRASWDEKIEPLGDEMLQADQFAGSFGRPWILQTDQVTEATATTTDDGPDGRRKLIVDIRRAGSESWIPQLLRIGLPIEKGRPYTVSFRARADQDRTISVNCMNSDSPWGRLGLDLSPLKLTDQWQTFRYTFLATGSATNGRITFSSLKPGRYELADVSFRSGMPSVLEDSKMAWGRIPVPPRGAMPIQTNLRRDFINFLWETEQRYWSDMYRFIKEELGAKQPISGTQLSYSPPSIQASLDYIDAHAYWQHPRFPGRPWDRRNWNVLARAMVAEPPGTIGSLASRRVAGLPFTISEYNHPEPNPFAAEGFPMLAAYGAAQQWNGLFPFTWSHTDSFRPDRLSGFFDVQENPSRLVHMPACVGLFMRGDLGGAKQSATVSYPPEAQRETLYRTLNVRDLTTAAAGLSERHALIEQIEMNLSSDESPKEIEPVDLFTQSVFELPCRNGRIVWNAESKDSSYLTVDSERSKIVTGFVGNQAFDLGEVKIQIGKTQNDWATLSLTALDRPERMLLAATGRMINTDAELRELGNDRITLDDRWGRAPIRCEGIPAELEMPFDSTQLKVWALNGDGERRRSVPVRSAASGRCSFTIGPEYQTLWYELEIVKSE